MLGEHPIDVMLTATDLGVVRSSTATGSGWMCSSTATSS